MSTRCNIIVADAQKRIQLYRHCDGYPDTEHGVLATLPQALPFAWPLPRFEADDFAAALIRAWKKHGGDIYIDGSPDGWELVHGEVEWVYLITQRPDSCLRIYVYDWQPYEFEQDDPDVHPPRPADVWVITPYGVLSQD